MIPRRLYLTGADLCAAAISAMVGAVLVLGMCEAWMIRRARR